MMLTAGTMQSGTKRLPHFVRRANGAPVDPGSSDDGESQAAASLRGTSQFRARSLLSHHAIAAVIELFGPILACAMLQIVLVSP